jgi:hypothetical protein
LTVWSHPNDLLDVGRAVQLAVYAYESRRKKLPPMLDGKFEGMPHILAMQYRAREPDAKTFTVTQAEYRHMLAFAAVLECVRERRQHEQSTRTSTVD